MLAGSQELRVESPALSQRGLTVRAKREKIFRISPCYRLQTGAV